VATNPLPEPRDPIEDDIADAMADPEFVASLEEFEAAEDRGEPLPTYSTEEVWAYLEEQRRKRAQR
jgi:hypothetical protein